MTVVWVVAPCSLVEVYRHIRGTCCLHHQGELQILLRAQMFENKVLRQISGTQKDELSHLE
jgi:hypothetical protein